MQEWEASNWNKAGWAETTWVQGKNWGQLARKGEAEIWKEARIREI